MSLLQNAANQEPVYRKVAIVENFFDIIYTVHVELEGRPGKHAGQKRTYRTVSIKFKYSVFQKYDRFAYYLIRNVCNLYARIYPKLPPAT